MYSLYSPTFVSDKDVLQQVKDYTDMYRDSRTLFYRNEKLADQTEKRLKGFILIDGSDSDNYVYF